MENAGIVVTRQTLIDRVWGFDYVGDTKTLDVHVKRLRAKVEPSPDTPGAHRHHPRAWLQAELLSASVPGCSGVTYRPVRRNEHAASRSPPAARPDSRRRARAGPAGRLLGADRRQPAAVEGVWSITDPELQGRAQGRSTRPSGIPYVVNFLDRVAGTAGGGPVEEGRRRRQLIWPSTCTRPRRSCCSSPTRLHGDHRRQARPNLDGGWWFGLPGRAERNACLRRRRSRLHAHHPPLLSGRTR